MTLYSNPESMDDKEEIQNLVLFNHISLELNQAKRSTIHDHRINRNIRHDEGTNNNTSKERKIGFAIFAENQDT